MRLEFDIREAKLGNQFFFFSVEFGDSAKIAIVSESVLVPRRKDCPTTHYGVFCI